MFALDSNDYKIKIVDFLKENGMNYWATEILHHLYHLYPKEYLEKY